MKTTRFASKGKVIVEKTAEDTLLRPFSRFPETRLEDVVGCLKYKGRPKTISQMKRGIQRQIKKRHDGGRY